MPFGSLWLPVLVAAAAVWIASAIVWMALRKLALEPGQYMLPYMPDMKDCKSPAVVKRFEDGPIALLRVQKNGVPTMGTSLTLYFLYCFLVSFVTAYIARHMLTYSASFQDVFRLTGTIACGVMTGLIFAWLWPHV